MCGIFGIAGGGINVFDLNILRTMGLLSNLRGTDSWGMAAVDLYATLKPIDIYKSNTHFGSPEDIKKATTVAGKLVTIQKDFILGHTRWATQGATSIENAQPIVNDTWVCAHNGDIKSKHILDLKTETGTDSEALVKHITQHGLVSTLESLREEDDAYAFVGLNLKDRHIYMAVNEKRPLAFLKIEGRAVLYFMSDHRDLAYLADKHRIKGDIYYIESNTMLKFHTVNNVMAQFPLKYDRVVLKRDIIKKPPIVPAVIANANNRLVENDGYFFH